MRALAFTTSRRLRSSCRVRDACIRRPVSARYIFRSEPEEVFAFASYGHDARFKEVEEMGSVVMRFPEGRLAQVVASQGAASEYRVVGTKGDLRVEPAFGYTSELKHTLTIDGKSKEKTFAKRDQFAPELVYFSDCIREDREPEPSGEEGLVDMRILRADAAADDEAGDAEAASGRGEARRRTGARSSLALQRR